MNRFKIAIFATIMSTFISCSTEIKVDLSNPLLNEWETPFNIAPFELIKADHYIEAVNIAIEELSTDINAIIENSEEPSIENVIIPFDRSGKRLRELKDLFEMSEASISTPDYQRVSEIVTPQFISAWDSVYMNDTLFQKVNTVQQGIESGQIEPQRLERRLTQKIYDKFIKGGANLSPEQKSELTQLNAQIALLTTKFTHNLIAENDRNFLELKSNQIKGIPQTIRTLAAQEAKRRGINGSWVFSLNPTSMIPLLTYCEDRAAREQIYKAYLKRGANGDEFDNRQIVRDVTILRQKRAQLLGYSNHAEYVISDQMAGSPEAVYKLLDSVGIWNTALKKGVKERDYLEKMFRDDTKNLNFESWDWWFYADKLRNSRYNISSNELHNYFSLSGVKTGMFTLANRLYGLIFRPVDAPVYDIDCTAYEVLDNDNSLLGVLYLDLFARPTKGQGAWCGNLREQSYSDDGERIIPIVAMVCNFANAASDNDPILLNQDQVETIFHEFGHALHFLMQDVKYQTLAAVEGDFVEFPSQVMENWAFEPEMLRMYAVHHRTGKPMTEQLIKNIVKSKRFNQGYETLSVLSAALLDLDLQSLSIEELEELDIAEFTQERLNGVRGLVRQIEPRYHLTNFAHLFTYDYSAGYYFYLWAELIDKEFFADFKQSGDIFSKSIADKMRHEVLERGGERGGEEMIERLIGRKPSPKAIIESRGL